MCMDKDASNSDDLAIQMGNLSMGPEKGQAGCGAEDFSTVYQYTCKECGQIYVGQTHYPKSRQADHYRTTGNKLSEHD
jgi:hypothetical protein